jgi:hypothetical protein
MINCRDNRNRGLPDGQNGRTVAITKNFGKTWELYNIDNDRSELNDLASQYPEKVREFDQLWNEWAARSFVETEKIKQPAKGMPKIYYFSD